MTFDDFRAYTSLFKMPGRHRMTSHRMSKEKTQYFWYHQLYQYLSDFDNSKCIKKPVKVATKWHTDHKNPINIDRIDGVKSISSKNSSFDGLSFDVVRAYWLFPVSRLFDDLRLDLVNNYFCHRIQVIMLRTEYNDSIT